jgi:hypothetical protein
MVFYSLMVQKHSLPRQVKPLFRHGHSATSQALLNPLSLNRRAQSHVLLKHSYASFLHGQYFWQAWFKDRSVCLYKNKTIFYWFKKQIVNKANSRIAHSQNPFLVQISPVSLQGHKFSSHGKPGFPTLKNFI